MPAAGEEDVLLVSLAAKAEADGDGVSAERELELCAYLGVLGGGAGDSPKRALPA